MRLPEQKPGDNGIANDFDPRDGADAEVIDLAQRNAFPAVARPAGKSDALGLVLPRPSRCEPHHLFTSDRFACARKGRNEGNKGSGCANLAELASAL